MSNQARKTPKNKNVKPGDLRSLLKKKGLKIHFVGIGGVSMYSLAMLSKERGFSVSGSDESLSDRVKSLMNVGISVTVGHKAELVSGKELVVYSHAIPEDNPEREEAERLGILQVTRAQLLGELMLKYKTRIGVSGTHGKSTTTAILDKIFHDTKREPTTLSGAELESGSPLRQGGDDFLIYESCEYKDSFLSFSPGIALALNLEYDHPDYFENIKALRDSFVKALSRATRMAVINLDDQNLKKIYPLIKKRCEVVTFGSDSGAEYRYFINSFLDGGFSFTLYRFEVEIGEFEIHLSAPHFVTDAVGAIIVALECGVSYGQIREAVANFSGISRRMELLGTRHGRAIYYDYAHHPTEIYATLSSLKQRGSEGLTVVFKPHTYSRTKALWEEFCAALSLADRVIITDIYPAREKPIEGVTAKRLAEDIRNATYCPDSRVAIALLEQGMRGPIILMGAGDMEKIRYDIFEN